MNNLFASIGQQIVKSNPDNIVYGFEYGDNWSGQVTDMFEGSAEETYDTCDILKHRMDQVKVQNTIYEFISAYTGVTVKSLNEFSSACCNYSNSCIRAVNVLFMLYLLKVGQKAPNSFVEYTMPTESVEAIFNAIKSELPNEQVRNVFHKFSDSKLSVHGFRQGYASSIGSIQFQMSG